MHSAVKSFLICICEKDSSGYSMMKVARKTRRQGMGAKLDSHFEILIFLGLGMFCLS